MKLIISIPEDVYTRLFDNGIQDNEIVVDDVCEMARAIRLGTSLEQEPCNDEISIADANRVHGLKKALEIIDKHIGGEENEE